MREKYEILCFFENFMSGIMHFSCLFVFFREFFREFRGRITGCVPDGSENEAPLDFWRDFW